MIETLNTLDVYLKSDAYYYAYGLTTNKYKSYFRPKVVDALCRGIERSVVNITLKFYKDWHIKLPDVHATKLNSLLRV